MEFKNGDILTMKKPHPCGTKEFKVLHCGTDVKIQCIGCSRSVMVPRLKIEKSIKKVNGGPTSSKPET